MLGFWRRKPRHAEPDLTAAARQLAKAPRTDPAKHRRRTMTNRLRADLRAKGIANLPPIDWSTFE